MIFFRQVYVGPKKLVKKLDHLSLFLLPPPNLGMN